MDHDAQHEQLLDRRALLTEGLGSLPYDLILYLERAVVHSDLGYPDLAAGDAYRALLLADEVANEGFEYHHQALESLLMRSAVPFPDVLTHGHLPAMWSASDPGDSDDGKTAARRLATIGSIRAYQILSLSLLLCGCLKSAATFCYRGLRMAPENQELLNTKAHIQTVGRRKLRRDDFDINDLPDYGLVRREVYPWNEYEPDRFSSKSLAALNADFKVMAPKCVVRAATLPVLLEGACETDSYDIIPTCKQLGIFAQEDMEPGEIVLREYSLLTANNRLKDSVCDACSSELPPLGSENGPVNCSGCHDESEPDRFSSKSLAALNADFKVMAPKCVVRAATLPVLLEGACETDSYDIIPTCKQLGIFAQEDMEPGEIVLREYSLLTANNRLKDSVCDACSSELPPLGSENGPVNCSGCHDTVFCSGYCHDEAQKRYHPAVCDKDVDAIAEDPDAFEADETLYLLLLARVLALAAHQEINPLDAQEVRFIWGDFLPTRSNDINVDPNAGPPPEWTLPFSFKYNIETPLHVLEKMDVDIFASLAEYDVWVLNTLYAKFRGTASARKNPRDGRPDVAAVHPYWCLANHDCDPNVTWDWGGRMVLWARKERVVGAKPGGIRRGEEILNHYCDVSLPVQQRREWARGSLGGWCMCQRCRTEATAQS
ncbi:wd and tetratricopeptide repeat protein [Ophiocordyceps sinensis CO18]|uniref:Wd and tetratricopeptide repeat protein n=1 Tax=Ophiocordyceps sinensis (strain Co18 / CGMCC 3.14243) TaxID=911162 RepID=T5A4A9_OPHSC|nr:wd and tetratricopeptide repeat protein [Ophiocordyceps sinensis CO18]